MSKLVLDNVKYSYQGKYQIVNALNGISYEFEPGKLYSIVGSSGSGKTTLLSLMATLDFPSEGKVIYDEKSTGEINCDKYRLFDVAVIYQNYNLFQKLSILENVTFQLKFRKIKAQAARKIAVEKLLSVGLNEKHFKRFPPMLSGGEQQRVAVARALASGTSVILADEPTGNLDEENGHAIFSMLKDLAHKENKCVIVVTHDRALADMSDEIITMKDGKFV